MKKLIFRLVLFISLILFHVTPAFAYSQENLFVVDLIAGQNEVAGSIKVWDDGSSLFVLYETFGSWCLTETHLAVASSLNDIAQANGNPIPGQFPYKSSHKCATNYLYKIPLENNVCTLYIAAHAVVKSPNSKETAWGSGFDFPGKNWGTYFTYESNACNVTPSPTDSETPTSTPPTPTETPSPTDTPPIPTDTVTTTPAPTDTPPACQPTVLTADFSQVADNGSVEGMGVVIPDLNIDARGTAIKLLPGVAPTAYIAPNNDPTAINAGIAPTGGFTDFDSRAASEAHLYTFTFASGVSASNFSILMQDYGDWNPTGATNHYASMIAYDAQGLEVARHELNYTTPPSRSPTSSDLYGNLQVSGDAAGASLGQPGNWMWEVSGSGIVRVVLSFGEGYDPNFGLTLLSYTTDCSTGTTNTSLQLGSRYVFSQQHGIRIRL